MQIYARIQNKSNTMHIHTRTHEQVRIYVYVHAYMHSAHYIAIVYSLQRNH